jgi:asparagine synthase (glutamine-hydrolysing)
MCGIAGTISLRGAPADRARLEAMAARLAHRGPDSEGVQIDGHVGLASRRLSIVDLSEAGRQPLANEDSSAWIVFNGAVYNYRELRPELEHAGHRFRSQTDTEVVLHAYEEWGSGCLDRFNGMFAFAVWDATHGRLFCARDRLGVKPFYYTERDGTLLFASEPKALLAALDSAPPPDEQAIADFIALDYVDAGARTFFSSIQQLVAGHSLLVDRDRVSVRRWWDITPHPADEQRITADDAVDEFRALFDDAVRLRLRSDVPVGSCLSGGLDSSAVVCTVNEFLERSREAESVGKTQKTFSATFPGERFDESVYIDAVGAAARVEQHRVAVDGHDLLGTAREMLRAQDEPVGSTSIVAQWHVMRLARAGNVTVLLDGQGGDELLGGYHAFVGYHIADLLRTGQPAAAARELRAYHRGQAHSWLRSARLALVPLIPQRARTRLRQLDKRSGALLSPKLHGLPDEPRSAPPGFGKLEAERYHIYHHGLPALLRYEDRNSMAFSLEARLPFLDYRLVDLSFRLEPSALIASGATKTLLRRALADRLPALVRERQDKIGFLTPQARWLREAGADIARTLERPDFGGGYLSRDGARHLVARLERGERGIDFALWRCLCLDLWLQELYGA